MSFQEGLNARKEIVMRTEEHVMHAMQSTNQPIQIDSIGMGIVLNWAILL